MDGFVASLCGLQHLEEASSKVNSRNPLLSAPSSPAGTCRTGVPAFHQRHDLFLVIWLPLGGGITVVLRCLFPVFRLQPGLDRLPTPSTHALNPSSPTPFKWGTLPGTRPYPSFIMGSAPDSRRSFTIRASPSGTVKCKGAILIP